MARIVQRARGAAAGRVSAAMGNSTAIWCRSLDVACLLCCTSVAAGSHLTTAPSANTMRALALGFAVVATGCADAFSASGAASSVVMSPSSLQLRGSCAPQALGLGTAGIRSCVAANGARVRMSQNTMESAKQFYPATESTLTAEQVLVLGSFAPRGAPCTV